MSQLDEESKERARARLAARRAANVSGNGNANAPASGSSRASGRGSAGGRGESASTRSGGSARIHGRGSASASVSGSARASGRGSARTSAGSVNGVVTSIVGGMVNFISQNLIAKLVLAAALVLLVFCVVRSCSAQNETAQVSLEQQEVQAAETETQEVQVEEQDPINEDALYALLEDEYASALIEAAQTDTDAAWIAAHPDSYTVDGSIVQYKLLKLAAVDPAARSFVREWPEKYPQETGEKASAVNSGEIPLLHQWDKRWGYTLYCNTTFALTGCCPTSFAMVYQGLTGDNSQTPYTFGVWADEHGYMDEYNGTDTGFLWAAASAFGLNMDSVSVSSSSLISALNSGRVVICNVGPGDFTTTGHFIVITGLDSSGQLIINDPFSSVRSEKRWDADTVISQTKALWAFWV
jgi:hypothetical protein